MKVKFILGAMALSTMAGCSGVSYVMENYQGEMPVKFVDKAGQKFRIFDKPAQQRLMITPSLGASFAQGATLGSTATPEVKYQAAAAAYVKSTGRNCKMGDMRLIIEPQWETFYTCK